jgi:hypothetical protein
MATELMAFNWILEAKTLSELQTVAKKIEASFIDVGFAKCAFEIRKYELMKEVGLIDNIKIVPTDEVPRTLH